MAERFIFLNNDDRRGVMDDPRPWYEHLPPVLASFAGAACTALLQDALTLRRFMAMVFVGFTFSVCFAPLVCDWAGWSGTTAHCGMAYALGLAGMTLSRALITSAEQNCGEAISRFIGRVLGAADKPPK